MCSVCTKDKSIHCYLMAMSKWFSSFNREHSESNICNGLTLVLNILLNCTFFEVVHIDDEVNIRFDQIFVAFEEYLWFGTGDRNRLIARLTVNAAVILPTLLYACELRMSLDSY